jgi:spermidine/putrescine transport system permease protein
VKRRRSSEVGVSEVSRTITNPGLPLEGPTDEYVDDMANRGARRRFGGGVLGVPVLGWMAFFLAFPYVLLMLQSFWQAGLFSTLHVWNLQNYTAVLFGKSLAGDIYLPVMLRSIENGMMVAVLATLIGFPVAYLLAFKLRRRRMLVYTLVIVPLWASYLLRAYAWKVILGNNGLLGSVLDHIGLGNSFLNNILYSRTAIVITLTHIFTPFMILSIYSVLERVPASLIDASKDLGVGRLGTFFKVVLPLSLPGVVAGATFTLGLAAGDFVAPLLVGGPGNSMIGNIIYSEFGATGDYPLGSAIAFVLLAFVVVLVAISTLAERREQI